MDGKNMKRADQTYANRNRFNKINNMYVNESCAENDSTDRNETKRNGESFGGESRW